MRLQEEREGRTSHWPPRTFDKTAEDVEAYERVVQMGGIAEGTARVAAARSRLEEYPLDIVEEPPAWKQ